MIEGKSYGGKAADIWAAGATLYFFVVGRPPFYTFSNQELRKKILEEEYSILAMSNYLE
jgi:serine/threonine protein kinase